jgi:hypothetical protein
MVSLSDDVLNVSPIDLRKVDPQTQPTACSDMFRDKESIRGNASQRVIYAGGSLTVQSDPAIAMMIVEKIAKSLAANLKAQMPATANLGRGFR